MPAVVDQDFGFYPLGSANECRCPTPYEVSLSVALVVAMSVVLALAFAGTAVHTTHLNDPANRTRTVDGAAYSPGLTRVVTDTPESYPQA